LRSVRGKPTADGTMSLAELAAKAGVRPRTVRFYIARGLLPPPRKAGRGACYGPEHLERLELVRQLQGQGLMLAEIAQRLEQGEEAPALPEPAPCWAFHVSEEITVLVRADVAPWRLARIRRALGELARTLAKGKEDQP